MKDSILHGPMSVHLQQQQLFHMVPALAAADTGCGGGSLVAPMFPQIAQPTVFSDPESGLTCNISGSRKRARGEGRPSNSNFWDHHNQRQLLLQDPMLQAENIRPNQSANASTSGRQPLIVSQPSVASPGTNNANINIAPGSFSSGLISMLHTHSLETDALIRLHAEKLRSGLDEARKRQCRAVAAALAQQAQRRVVEKQAELVAAANRNAALEERLRQAAAESQAWFHVARNSEALVAGLRASLEQALLRKLNAGNSNGDCTATRQDLSGSAGIKEGYGDSEEEAASASGAAVSCSAPCAETNKPLFAGDERFFPCKSCDQADACVLLLPCRHLCLCPSCEPSVNDCPVCGSRKNARLQIKLS